MKNTRKIKTVAVELELVRFIAKLRPGECPWCNGASWYGVGHIESCPIGALRSVLNPTEVK